MKRISSLVALCLLCFTSSYNLHAQGTFQNLDFEQATIVSTGTEPYVIASSAIPGWTAYIGNNPVDTLLYNTVTLGSAAISIHDNNDTTFSLRPLQGNFSVILQHSTGNPTTGTVGIGQTARLPVNIASLFFYAASFQDLQVTFAGNTIPLIQVGTESNYTVLSGDISPYAGQAGELLFTQLGTSSGTLMTLDNIYFSTQAIPEPSPMALLALSALLFLGLKYRKQISQ